MFMSLVPLKRTEKSKPLFFASIYALYISATNHVTKKYTNYHLTFSYSGQNMSECLLSLADGYNVAMVFNNVLPVEFMGYKVVNADNSDLRYLDESGVICGLKYKKVRNKTANVNNSFVINL